MQIQKKNILNNALTVSTIIVFSLVILAFSLIIFIYKGVISSWKFAVLINKWYYEKLL